MTEVILTIFNVEVTRLLLSCLMPMVWLNDEVINLWMELMNARDVVLVALDGRRRTYFCNSFFYSKLNEGNVYKYSNVQRWTKNIDIFDQEMVIIPVNISNQHWCLAVIYMQKKEIAYYDSMNGSGNL